MRCWEGEERGDEECGEGEGGAGPECREGYAEEGGGADCGWEFGHGEEVLVW